MNQVRLNKLSWDYSQRREELYSYFSFLIWPFGTLVMSFNNWRRPYSRNLFWLFCIFFGFTFVIAGEGGADSARYATWLVQYAHSDMNLKELWQSFYSESSGSVDIFQPIVTYLVSRFTDNPVVLFTVFGMIFGYFYSRTLWYILRKIEGKITIVIFVYILTFALINPIWNINGFRMWTAAQVFLYGTLLFIWDRDTKGLLWAALSVFVHFSFLFPVAILIIYVLGKNRINIYMAFFILSAFMKELDLVFIRESLSFLPGFLQPRVTGYTNLDYAEFRADRVQQAAWYMAFSSEGLKWVVYTMAITVYFFYNNFLRQKKELFALFSFSILLYGFANIFSLLPSGGRMVVVANTFMFAFIAVFISLKDTSRLLPLIKTILVPLVALFCVVNIRVGMDYYGLMTIIGNPVLAAIYSETVPLIEQIKDLL